MSAEQPRADNYVTSQDFSANASSGGEQPSAQQPSSMPGGYTAPPKYVQQQHQYIAANDQFRPTQQQQHFYPPSNTAHQQQWQQQPQQQPQSVAPPVNQQSHPAPHANMQTKPHQGAQQHPYGPAADIPMPQGQQYGQVSFDEKFRPADNKPKWNDVWAAILFLAVFIALCVIGGFSINAYRETYSFQGSGVYDNTNTFTLDSNALILFAFILVMGFVLSFGYFGLAAMFPKQFIWITGILHCIFGFGSAIVYFYFHYYSAAIVFLIFAIFYVICFLSWRHRIPFSAQIFQFTMKIMGKYPSTLTVSALGLIFTLAFGAFWTLTLVGAYVKYHPNGDGQTNPACNTPGGSCSSASLIVVLIFITFAGFYTSEIIKNVIHTTISGIFGSYYYGFNTPSGVPRHAAWASFRRSMTYSFGSIAFGSLVVSIISFIRQLSAVGKVAAAQEGDTCMYLIFCCFNCIAQIIEGLVRWFNHYAYTQIALYGKKYLQAASDTWRIFKDRGIDAIINDLLIDNVLTMGSILVAYATALLAYLWLRYTNPAYNSSGGFFVPVVAFGFLIGLQMTNIAVVPIKSGVATLFVAMAEDPDALRQNFPDLYQTIVQTYPRLQWGVQRGEV